METADLEMSIRKTQIDAYSVELRFNYESHADVNASCEGSLQADHGHLLEFESDLKEYGRHLTEYFFEDPKVRDTFLCAINRPFHQQYGVGAAKTSLGAIGKARQS